MSKENFNLGTLNHQNLNPQLFFFADRKIPTFPQEKLPQKSKQKKQKCLIKCQISKNEKMYVCKWYVWLQCLVAMIPPSLLHFCCSSLFGHLENTKKSPFLHNFESFKLCGGKILFVFFVVAFSPLFEVCTWSNSTYIACFLFLREGICEESKTSRLILD